MRFRVKARFRLRFLRKSSLRKDIRPEFTLRRSRFSSSSEVYQRSSSSPKPLSLAGFSFFSLCYMVSLYTLLSINKSSGKTYKLFDLHSPLSIYTIREYLLTPHLIKENIRIPPLNTEPILFSHIISFRPYTRNREKGFTFNSPSIIRFHLYRIFR